MFCSAGEEKKAYYPAWPCVSLLAGVLFSWKTLYGKSTVLGALDVQRLKRSKPCSPALEKQGRRGPLSLCLSNCLPCWELVSQISQLPSAELLRDPSTSDPGGPTEVGEESHPLSAYSPCPYFYPTVDAPRDGVSIWSPFSLFQAHPHRDVGP